jgi:hypothetical protein
MFSSCVVMWNGGDLLFWLLVGILVAAYWIAAGLVDWKRRRRH